VMVVVRHVLLRHVYGDAAGPPPAAAAIGAAEPAVPS